MSTRYTLKENEKKNS